jgi:hypothetical protein
LQAAIEIKKTTLADEQTLRQTKIRAKHQKINAFTLIFVLTRGAGVLKSVVSPKIQNLGGPAQN